jgi:hypothetical protein
MDIRQEYKAVMLVVYKKNIEGTRKCQENNYNSGILSEAYDTEVVIYVLNKIFIKIRCGDQICPSFFPLSTQSNINPFIYPSIH